MEKELLDKFLEDQDLMLFLKGVELFEDFSDLEISSLIEKSNIKDYRKNQIFVLVENKAEDFYIVVNGWVKLFRETRDGHESILAMLGSGDSFGKASMFEGEDYQYNAQAAENSKLLKIPATYITEMAENSDSYNKLLEKLQKARLTDIKKLGLQSEHFAIMTSAQRVGCFLLKMCKDITKGDTTLRFPYEKTLVAGSLGMKPETFSRALSQLTEIGVQTTNSEVKINNIEQLHSFVCNHCSATCDECKMAEDNSF